MDSFGMAVKAIFECLRRNACDTVTPESLLASNFVNIVKHVDAVQDEQEDGSKCTFQLGPVILHR